MTAYKFFIMYHSNRLNYKNFKYIFILSLFFIQKKFPSTEIENLLQHFASHFYYLVLFLHIFAMNKKINRHVLQNNKDFVHFYIWKTESG